MSKDARALVAALVVVATIYGGVSFALWDANPANWSVHTRGAFAWFAGAMGLGTWFATITFPGFD